MPLCNNCGTENSHMAAFCQSCGKAIERAGESAPGTPDRPEYGGFWKRVVAWLIDTIIVSVATGAIVATTFGVGFPLTFVVHWLYEAFLQSSEWQTTLGKRVFNLTVTGMDGSRISFARATGRHFAKWVSALTLGVGFVMVAFTRKKQGLHDLIAETVVRSR